MLRAQTHKNSDYETTDYALNSVHFERPVRSELGTWLQKVGSDFPLPDPELRQGPPPSPYRYEASPTHPSSLGWPLEFRPPEGAWAGALRASKQALKATDKREQKPLTSFHDPRLAHG